MCFIQFFLFRPRVQLIAASKRLAGRLLKIAFFELNGLPHGEIDLLTAPECDKFRVGKITFDSIEHIMAVLFLPADSASLPFGSLFGVIDVLRYLSCFDPLLLLASSNSQYY